MSKLSGRHGRAATNYEPSKLMDIVSPEERSRMMAAVRSKNTKPELFLRRGLHALGYRYRLHRRDLPGTPDLAFPGRHAVVFVNGCFWHGHNCPAAKLPKTRTEFWRDKIESNRSRDARNLGRLEHLGWSALVVWECELRSGDAVMAVARWLERAGTHKMLPDSSLADT